MSAYPALPRRSYCEAGCESVALGPCIEKQLTWQMDPIFAAVTQATEEAVDNALVAAKTMTGANYWVVPALPHDQLQDILRKHNTLKQ